MLPSRIRATDVHTGGEPLPVPGAPVAERRARAIEVGRSSTGSGTCDRLAVPAAEGRLRAGAVPR